MNSKLLTLKAKKIGVRLGSIREKSGLSTTVVENNSGIPSEQLQRMEQGLDIPSLPQLESLSRIYNSSVEDLTSDPLKPKPLEVLIPVAQRQLESLQNRFIGLIIKETRVSKDQSATQIAEKCDLTQDQFNQYESGLAPIPFPILDEICAQLGLSVYSLRDVRKSEELNDDAIATPESSPKQVDIPDDLLEFVSQPVNRPFIELAKRLSLMNAEELRNIAESILEITL
jgi:transcriptional regulator with XRE-family HTH domain